MFHLLLHVHDTPARLALAFAIGVFIAFFPILGIHTGMALAIAFLFRLSRLAILLGAYVNNPWTLAPLYMTGTALGCALLGVPPQGLGAVDWSLSGAAFRRALIDTLRPYLWPYIVGNVVLGALCGVVAFFAVRALLERRARPAGA
jgi:uncharacterized protein (DUF2062 family)